MDDTASILAVDDASEALFLLVRILKQAGYRVRPADSGESALAAVAASPPDLILLDIRMPGMGGLEVCRRLKNREETRHIPIILISAIADVQDRVEGLQLGAVDYMTKPFHPDLLLARIKTHLALSRANLSLGKKEGELFQTHEKLQIETTARWGVEAQLRQSLVQADRSRRAMLSTMEDLTRAERQTVARARQQCVVAELGLLALTGVDLASLMSQAVQRVAQELGVETCAVLEFLPDRSALLLTAGVGWPEGMVGHATVDPVSGSQAAFTLQSKAPVIVEDLRTETRFRGAPMLHDFHIISGLSAVIGDLQQPCGVLGAHTARRREFTANDVDFIQGMANILGSASQRQRHEAEIFRTNRLYATLSEIDQTIVRSESREELFPKLCHVAVKVGGFQTACLYLKTGDEDPVRLVARYPAPSDEPHTLGVQLCECGMAAEAMRTGLPCLIDNAQVDERTACCRAFLPHTGIRSCGAFPFRFHGEAYGAFCTSSVETGLYNRDEVRLLEEIAEHISYAMEHLDQEEQRRQAEAERERLMSAIEQVSEVIIITDVAGTMQYVNPAFVTVTGYTREEALGQTPRILKSGKQDEALYRSLWKTIAAGQTWKGRLDNKRKDGRLYTEEATISPAFDAAGQIVNYVAVKRDITEHLRLESQLHQAQKMESVGRLAGGVAHDFNNMLSVILGFTELALRKVEPVDPLHANLVEVHHAAKRSADIVRQLMTFARKQGVDPRVLDLNESVKDMLKLLQQLIGEDIELAWLPATGTWPVKIDPAQLNQILANLCANARDAITDVGKITIETRNVNLDETYFASRVGGVPGEYALLAVSDNGCGMDTETLDRVFEPFFTTKGPGHGTGLGLATVYGIVKQNAGYIDVDSEPGKGAAFQIYLPRHGGHPIEGDARPDVKIPHGRGETVLVVEDDVAVLQLACTILRGLDYIVVTATTPDEALRLAADYAGEIQLLLTDVVLPGMNGQNLSEKFRASRPATQCLFMSGYPADIIANRGALDEEAQFIQKPFSTAALARAVGKALEAR